ncbi:MAG: L-histidine N(alpha)-methyltransferase, partial [Pseudomonadales bacterium]
MSSLPQVYFYDRSKQQANIADEVLAGLLAEQKYISPKFFYDAHGSALFTAITRLPEYYLTRVEMALLTEHATAIAEKVGANCQLIEYGSGSSEKIRLLLESLRPSLYAPLDISADYLARAANALASEFPWLEVHAVNVDFTDDFTLPFKHEGRRVSFFPGS